ncbi:5-hydroxytryptamine receptor 3A-like [Cynoglossus semilaevis]|uniref:5-hydroxytryptamine receptor 3A-like n=1 Tax=Cynoglossus semilaevis TaxID=244447 RepID=UPI000D62C6A4|nr:5-hydroxytryptamine receptor 3A-like [Cynoglossus semilaevis]
MTAKKVCSYQDVLDYLNMTRDNNKLQLSRPVLDHTHPTVIEMDLILYALLAVIEKTQTFIPFVWVSMMWQNEFISWDPEQFCGITHVSVPKDLLWRPDLFIYEMVQKDDSPQNSFMYLSHNGIISSEEDVRVISTCKMDVYKFPFDTQKCNITIGSAIHSANEIRMIPFSNSSRATQFSQEIIRTQGEWEFIHLSVVPLNFSYQKRQWEQLIYTFTIKRRPFLHVINFLLPILFFLSLDLASFFISDCRGEKLGFKVTVLLAISVLLLILNDILPCMSNNTPLIATYCIVIFALMLLSLLETILVTYLIERDSTTKKKLQQQIDYEEQEHSDDSYSAAGLLVFVQGNSSSQCRESQVLLLILDELKGLQKTQKLHLSPREEVVRPILLARRINRCFFTFYVITVSLFLSLIFCAWML